MSKPIIWTSIAAVLVSSVSLAASGWVIANERSASTDAPASYKPYSSASRNVARIETKDESSKPGSHEAVENEVSAKAVKAERTTKTEQVSVKELEPAELKVRRLVVASGVENREPIGASETFEAGDDRVYAFVELANRSSHDGGIVLVFEKGSTRAGMVELDVPGDVGRWRTWGYTRGLRQPGTWNVVVREQSSGKELARTTIEVETQQTPKLPEKPVQNPVTGSAPSVAAAVVEQPIHEGMI